MNASIFYCFFAAICTFLKMISSNCPDNVPFFDLRIPVLYESRNLEHQENANLLSTHPIKQLESMGEWNCSSALGAMALIRPNPECSLGKCLFVLHPLRRINDQKVEIVYARSFELFRFPGFVQIPGIQPMYCAINRGLCGASVPLYSFILPNSSNHILSIEMPLPDSNHRFDSGGDPICYLWPLSAVQFSMPSLSEFGCPTVENLKLAAERDGNGEKETAEPNWEGEKDEEVEESGRRSGMKEEDEKDEEVEESGRRNGMKEEDEKEEEGRREAEEEEEQSRGEGGGGGALREESTTEGADEHEEEEQKTETITSSRTKPFHFIDPEEDDDDISTSAPPPAISHYFLVHWHWWILAGALSALLFCALITTIALCCVPVSYIAATPRVITVASPPTATDRKTY